MNCERSKMNSAAAKIRAIHITEVGLSFYVVISWIQSAGVRGTADGPAGELR
jgi:hypothetical protein